MAKQLNDPRILSTQMQLNGDMESLGGKGK